MSATIQKEYETIKGRPEEGCKNGDGGRGGEYEKWLQSLSLFSPKKRGESSSWPTASHEGSGGAGPDLSLMTVIEPWHGAATWRFRLDNRKR